MRCIRSILRDRQAVCSRHASNFKHGFSHFGFGTVRNLFVLCSSRGAGLSHESCLLGAAAAYNGRRIASALYALWPWLRSCCPLASSCKCCNFDRLTANQSLHMCAESFGRQSVLSLHLRCVAFAPLLHESISQSLLGCRYHWCQYAGCGSAQAPAVCLQAGHPPPARRMECLRVLGG